MRLLFLIVYMYSSIAIADPIRIVVGQGPGGGYDAYARLIAPRLAKELSTPVIVENRPGAGGLNALISLINQPSDGKNILLLNGEAALLNQLINDEGKYDISNLYLLGKVSYENRTLVVKKGSPLERIENFQSFRDTIFFGAESRIDTIADTSSIFCYSLSLRCKLILGYNSTAETSLALQRNEIQAIVTSESQALLYVDSGNFTAVAILGPSRGTLLPNVPSIEEIIKLSSEAKKWIYFRASLSEFGRLLVIPNNTPADQIHILQKSVETVLNDKDFIILMESAKRPIFYNTTDNLNKIYKDIMTMMTKEDKEKLKHIVLDLY